VNNESTFNLKRNIKHGCILSVKKHFLNPPFSFTLLLGSSTNALLEKVLFSVEQKKTLRQPD